MPPSTGEVTQILAAASRGDGHAAQKLFPLVYDQLRTLAEHYLKDQRPGHTLQPTALVHEAYLKLIGIEDGSWTDRGHFFCVAAVSMRHILVNYAKHKKRLKRGGQRDRVAVDAALALVEERAIDVVVLDEALTKLATLDPQQARVVELRFFAGLSVEETAKVLGISERTVHREWSTARLWLRAEIAGDGANHT